MVKYGLEDILHYHQSLFSIVSDKINEQIRNERIDKFIEIFDLNFKSREIYYIFCRIRSQRKMSYGILYFLANSLYNCKDLYISILTFIIKNHDISNLARLATFSGTVNDKIGNIYCDLYFYHPFDTSKLILLDIDLIVMINNKIHSRTIKPQIEYYHNLFINRQIYDKHVDEFITIFDLNFNSEEINYIFKKIEDGPVPNKIEYLLNKSLLSNKNLYISILTSIKNDYNIFNLTKLVSKNRKLFKSEIKLYMAVTFCARNDQELSDIYCDLYTYHQFDINKKLIPDDDLIDMINNKIHSRTIKKSIHQVDK